MRSGGWGEWIHQEYIEEATESEADRKERVRREKELLQAQKSESDEFFSADEAVNHDQQIEQAVLQDPIK